MKFRCQMIPILLTLMAVLPWTAAVVNCWKACKNCRDNTNHPEILDVYCSMCRECRKRRSWMRNSGVENAPMPMGIHDDYQNQQNEFQTGCPTPPFCESSAEQPYTERTTLSSGIAMPAPISTSSTCPPYPACIKRKRPTTQYLPQQYTTRQYNPPPYYPPPQNSPPYYPPQPDPPQPPPTLQQNTEHPPCSPCVPLCPMTCLPGGPVVPGSDTKQWNTKSNGQSEQEATEFSFVYVGVPKELVKEIG